MMVTYKEVAHHMQIWLPGCTRNIISKTKESSFRCVR